MKKSIGFLFLIVTLSLFLQSCAGREYLVKENNKYNISYKYSPWTISFPIDNYQFKYDKNTSDDASCYYLFTNNENNLIVSFYLEPAKKSEDATSYRDQTFSTLKYLYPKVEHVIKTNLRDCSVVEYYIPELYSEKINQQNMNAHFVKDGLWVDLHISKVNFHESERETFYNFLKSVSFSPAKMEGAIVSSPDSLKEAQLSFMEKASAYYLYHDLDNAIKYYQKVLDIEMANNLLEKKMWYVLVDNLGMAYGVNGDLNKARSIFEYGLSKDSSYPLFYYNIGCIYGEKGDLDSSIVYLKLAFERKSNVLEGEDMPNPKDDSSFQKFINDDKFKKLLKELYPD
ncbi:MAG: hypothetical protein Q8N83_14010 [Ignavibacteria bacterium]|nr:hypothetical protein [Ignavibacteria bacterium]